VLVADTIECNTKTDKIYKLQQITLLMSNEIIIASKIFEEIINKEWATIDADKRNNWKYIFAVNKNCPNIKVHSNNQVIFSLTDKYIAKIKGHIAEELLNKNPDLYIFGDDDYGPNWGNFTEVPIILKEWGYNPVSHTYFGLDIKPNKITVFLSGYGFAICPDLTEGGKFTLAETTEENIEVLKNKKDIKIQLDKVINSLIKDINNPSKKFGAYADRHFTDQNMTNALKRMFHIQIDTYTKVGTLQLADLDHVLFYKK
jgi:hypothetical protein